MIVFENDVIVFENDIIVFDRFEQNDIVFENDIVWDVRQLFATSSVHLRHNHWQLHLDGGGTYTPCLLRIQ